MRVLLIEDNDMLGDGLVTALKQEGHAVDWFRNGNQAKSAPLMEAVDVIVLDLGLPGMDGMSLLQYWRAQQLKTPVLILTARDTVESKVAGLDAGADDFLVKPFERAELLARLRSLVRRSQATESNATSVINFGAVMLDTGNQQACYHGRNVPLSRREFILLQKLLENPGKAFSREQLQQNLYGWDDDVASNTLEVYIHNIRKKLYPEIIRTLRGIGYMAGEGAHGSTVPAAQDSDT